MNRYFLTISLVILFLNLFGQFKGNNDGVKYYELGSKLIELGDYKGADSLLSLSLCTFKNSNVYYNRGISRFMLNDTIGFCEDLNKAANKYFDNESEKLFNSYCCKCIDTTYYDRKRNISDNQKYKYYEIVKKLKYSDRTIATYHDKNAENTSLSIDFGCEESLIGMGLHTTDIIAIYEILDSAKYYYRTTKPIIINNRYKLQSVKEKAKIFFESKYKELKSRNGVLELSVFFELTIGKNGSILNTKLLGTFPEVDISEYENELLKDVIGVANQYPKISPATFKNEKVIYISQQSIEF